MFADERKAKIEEILKKRASVSTYELTELFQVSVETIRRDLEYLESHGRLKRVHGGAVAIGRLQNYTSLSGRVEEHRCEKRKMALTACAHIQEGDYIALDTGSTALEMAAVLSERFRELTVLTHSLEAAKLLAEKENIRTVLAGGFYLPEERCFCGHLTIDMIRQMHVSKCFIAPSAISLDFGISDHIQELISVQRAFLEVSDQAYILADSSKFGICAPLKICDLSPAFSYITDSELPDESLRAYADSGFRVTRSGKENG